MAKKLVMCLLVTFFVLVMPHSLAATVHGIIYDMSLNPAENAIVKVDSIPEQTYVATDGSYSFVLSKDNYTITSTYQDKQHKYVATQAITIVEDGDYILDIILFLDLSEEQELLDEDVEIADIYAEEETDRTWVYVVIVLIALSLLAIVFIILKKHRRKRKKIIEADSLPDDIIKFVKQQGGRVTQKDIRKCFPLSEAKISLVISELEHKGLVKKIKKGKGNIILLK